MKLWRKPGETASGISDAEQELYGGRLRWDQSFVHHQSALTRMGFGKADAASALACGPRHGDPLVTARGRRTVERLLREGHL
ncbi:hypothetical protein ACFRNT_30010 [Streptomyces sp. NPDC056697]|uniref:hypothetical protein n=1 Tax=Streptomyces sp. NPDC056697 TaxID=3345915 RepID=UPI0036831056